MTTNWCARTDQAFRALALEAARYAGPVAWDDMKARWNLSDADLRPWKNLVRRVTLTQDLSERLI